MNYPFKVHVDMAVVKKHDPCEPYLRLVHKMIRDGKGTPLCVGEDRPGFLRIRAHEYDFLGDAVVPAAACLRVLEVTEVPPIRGKCDAALTLDDHTFIPEESEPRVWKNEVMGKFFDELP